MPLLDSVALQRCTSTWIQQTVGMQGKHTGSHQDGVSCGGKAKSRDPGKGCVSPHKKCPKRKNKSSIDTKGHGASKVTL
jgi:hypothetical protein